ncbi:Zinc finger MYM-type protein 1 [Merluccius polli]|uniref:Zinc finger MYM-type protein 1 n=1 Tax=Merluccius polli TaxID=89951 RepID=A0AA47NE97_MERPO|nr:Zinc finger MYM-type protein 1 [Merluccius polli]
MVCDDTDLRKRASALSSSYPGDLDTALAEELIQFRSFVSTEQDKTPANVLQVVLKNGLQTTFPNVFVALRLFLTLPVSNCEGERTFSKLKQIKNELRTTMVQKRLTSLSLMAIESDLVRELDFDDLISEFAMKKSRKKNF